MAPTALAIVWMIGSLVVGLFSIRRRLGFWGGFFFSVLLSPIIMILILMLTQPAVRTPNKV
jgi:fumarate reductase subunit C